MQTKPLWLVANWKMHGTHARVRDFAYRVNAALAEVPPHVRVVFCPPTVYVEAARSALPQNAQLQVGAQNCHTGVEGAFTGDVSATMLADVGANFVIIGHSERRQHHQESDALIAEKAKAARGAGLTPIVCIGESLVEYETGKTAERLRAQLQAFMGDIAVVPSAEIIVAYEPVWAIGSGKTPASAEIDAAHRVIQSTLGSAVTVLYGGSVKPANAAEILGIESVGGVLIGGASLRVDDMVAMIAAAGAAVIPA